MTYVTKNKGKVMLIVMLLLFVSALIIYSFQKSFFYTAENIDSDVYPSNLYVGDTLFYVDNSNSGGLVRWEFGDGSLSLNESGYHFFKKPGYYQVKFILNDQLYKSFSVEVKSKVAQSDDDYLTYIEAPTHAMQDENIVFRAVAKNAKLYSWKFGESGIVDAKESMIIYAYKEPGEYEVSLYTDNTAYPITHHITIYPSFKNMNDSLSIEDSFNEIDDDFRYHLQQISNGANFNTHYNYLINNYLCKNSNANVEVNKSKSNTFYYYCMGLRFDKNTAIQSVKVGFDEDVNCVTKVIVTQSK